MSDALWFRIGALIAVTLGAADLFQFHQLGQAGDVALFAAGLSALGVHTVSKAG